MTSTCRSPSRSTGGGNAEVLMKCIEYITVFPFPLVLIRDFSVPDGAIFLQNSEQLADSSIAKQKNTSLRIRSGQELR